jgi:hypothetical protein
MTMRSHSRPSAFSTAGMTPWLLDLATRLLARILNMPEPLLLGTGALVYAQVQEFENSVGRTLCPIRLLCLLRARLRRAR